MAKYLVLVEVVDEEEPGHPSLLQTIEGIGAIGEHVTVEKALNLEFIERIEGVAVWEADEDVGGDPLPTVAVIHAIQVQDKFSSGQYVDVILLPSDSPKTKTLHLTAVTRREE